LSNIQIGKLEETFSIVDFEAVHLQFDI